MCGIVGSVNWGDQQSVARMNQVQTHRGPDDDGIWFGLAKNGNTVGLGSRRLAILDLSAAGKMPMTTPDGNLTIVYNGEIYNFRELKQRLAGKGYQFSSDTDTEVVLYLYDAFGPDFVKQLNGMFSIAIWDNTQQHLFLARDHFGIKPLYYTQSNGQFAFASEFKSFLELPGFKRELNYEALHQYLTFLWVPDPLTILANVWKLPAGHHAIFKGGKLTQTRYWDLTFPTNSHSYEQDEQSLVEEARHRFSEVVKSQMISDVPLGAFLSAGLDSSSILACMAQHTGDPIRTFTIAFPENYRRGEVTLDDTSVAARTARHFGCQHSEILVEPDVVDLLPKLVWHMDEPTSDPAIITAYLINRDARRDVTVLLSGVGGDELFAGYRKYRAHYLARTYQRIPAWMRNNVVAPLVSSLPAMRGTPLKGYVRLAKKMVRSGSYEPRERFVTDSIYQSDQLKHQLYSAQSASLTQNFDARSKHFSYFEEVQDADFLNQMLYLDTKVFMTSLNLTYNDKMSMASSVEVRVPFLDWEFAQWVANHVPPTLKMKGKTTKHLLREAMRPWLPDEVLTQKKAGFGAPIDYWLANDLQEMVDDLLSESQVRKRGLFQPDQIQRLIQEQRKGKEDWSMQIWQFLTLELWMKAFLDHNP